MFVWEKLAVPLATYPHGSLPSSLEGKIRQTDKQNKFFRVEIFKVVAQACGNLILSRPAVSVHFYLFNWMLWLEYALYINMHKPRYTKWDDRIWLKKFFKKWITGGLLLNLAGICENLRFYAISLVPIRTLEHTEHFRFVKGRGTDYRTACDTCCRWLSLFCYEKGTPFCRKNHGPTS